MPYANSFHTRYPVINYHEVLGIAPGADQAAIKKAYRKKALLLHPDHNSSPSAEAEFIELTVAYEFLTANKIKQTSYQATVYEDERINTAARDFARMRYEKFVRRNSAFERLSIHKLFWGRKVTYIILVIAGAFLYDVYAPGKKVTLSDFNMETKDNSGSNSFVISGDGFSFRTRDIEVFRSTSIQVEHTPLFGVVTAYRLGQDHFEEEYRPSVSIVEYRFLLPLVVLACLFTLFGRVNTFENKLALKFAIIIGMFCYLLVFLIARF